MGNETVFVLTQKGKDEIKNHNRKLPEDTKRVLMLVDDESTVDTLARRAPPSIRAKLGNILKNLENEGFIQNRANLNVGNLLRIVTPKISAPAKKTGDDTLDFTKGIPALPPTDESEGKLKAEVARLKGEQEVAAIRVQLEAERAKVEKEAAKAREELEAARFEADRARTELEAAKVKAEVLAKRESETSGLRVKEATTKALAETEEARIKAEQERAEAKAERDKAEKEAIKAREELGKARLEADRARAELEVAKVRAEALAKREAEASRMREEAAASKAQAETEMALIKVEQERAEAKAERENAEREAAKVRDELEKARLETERARADLKAAQVKAEALVKLEAEASRLRVEEAAAKAKAEVESARLIAVQEAALAKVKAEAEAIAKQEAETARRMAEEEIVKAQAEAEAKAKLETEIARRKAEEEIVKAKAEAEAKAKLETEVARRKAQEEIAKARAEAESARLKAVQEAAKEKAEAETKAKQEAEAARRKAEEEVAKARAEAELIRLKSSQEAELAKAELKAALAKAEAEAKASALAESEAKSRKEVDAVVLKAKQEISEARAEAEAKAQREAKAAHFKAEQEIARIKAEMENQVRQSIKAKEDATATQSKEDSKHPANEAVPDKTKGIEVSVGAGELGGANDFTPFSIDLGPFVLNNLEKNTTPTPAQLADVNQLSGLSQESEENSFPLNDFYVNNETDEIPDPAEPVANCQEQDKAIQHEEIEPEKITPDTQQEIKVDAQVFAQQQAKQKLEAARLQAEQELARIKSEKEARQMADEQAKAWAEAEKRAKAQAANQVQVEHDAGKMPQAKVAYASRNPLPLSKIIVSLIILLVGLIVVLPYVWPMQDYIAQLEKKLSTQLHQPVHIAHLKATLLPLPKFELQEVSVGSAQELKASNVVLHFDVTSWFSEIKVIKSIEINDLELKANSFSQTLSWLQAAGGGARYPVARMELKRAHINGEGINLPPVNGKADWDTTGHLSKVLLRSEDGKLDVSLQHQQQWRISFRIKETSLPGLPGILFNELNAKGEVGEGEANFTDISGILYSGNLTGNGRLKWQNGWQMVGQLNVKALDLQEALPKLDIVGNFDADSSFKLNGMSLQQVAKAPYLEGNFTAGKGIINKIDLVKIAVNHQEATGGRTYFDELSGTFQVENNSLHLRQLKILTQVMKAIGTIDANPGGQLSGQLAVDLKMRKGAASLVLSGTVAEPIVRPSN